MPGADYIPSRSIPPEVLGYIPVRGDSNADLAREIAALRTEIAQLRADLAPVPSLILTGRDALAEFKRLVAREVA